MAADQYITIAILALTFTLLIKSKIPPVAVFVGALTLTITFRLAPRLYIPLSFSSILGGTCTLIGSSTNLVVAGMVMDFLAKGDPSAPPLRQIAMFDLAWIGLPATVAGIVFIMLTSRFLLPGTKEADSAAEITRLFGAEFTVTADAPIIGKRVEDMGYINPQGFQLLALKRNGLDAAEFKPQTKLEVGDVLVFSAMLEAIPDLWGTDGLEPVYGTEAREMVSARHSHRLVEVVVSRRAGALDRKIKELPLPEAHVQVSIIAISRGGKPVDGPM